MHCNSPLHKLRVSRIITKELLLVPRLIRKHNWKGSQLRLRSKYCKASSVGVSHLNVRPAEDSVNIPNI